MTYCKLDPFNLGTTQPITGPTPFTQSTWFADPNLKRPYSDQWNFGVQQQVTPKAVLTANYVGSVGRKLDIGGAYNVRLQPGPTPTNCSAAAINCGATLAPPLMTPASERATTRLFKCHLKERLSTG
jgi:hypothetical protein